MKRTLVSAVLLAGLTAMEGRAQVPTPPQAPSKGIIIQQVMVKVNGEILTKTDLELKQIQAIRDANPKLAGNIDLRNDATLVELLQKLTPDILVEAVDELLMVQRGRELGFALKEDDFKKGIDRIKADNKMNDEQFLQALKQEGMTMQSFRENYERSALVYSVKQREIAGRLNITEEEARQYYQAHQDEFMKPATAMLREIFVAVPSETRDGKLVFDPALDEAASKKIVSVRERAAKGEDFAALVAEVSESGSKANGGLVGPIVLDEMAPVIRDMMKLLKAGDISQPIRTSRGYQLIKLESRSESLVEPFDAVRPAISQRVTDQRMGAEEQKYLETLRATAIIEWKNDELRKMYERRRAEAKTP